MSILDDDAVRQQLWQAWRDSAPGTANSHEEGGFVLETETGDLIVERWPKGTKDEMSVPSHSGGRRGGLSIIATFHTHPNPGSDYQQEPGLTDIRAVRDDPDLGHAEFEGEYVIASRLVYRIERSGNVETLGEMARVLQIPSDSNP